MTGDGCYHPFSRNRFFAVAAADITADLPQSFAPGSPGALLFGSNSYSYKDSSNHIVSVLSPAYLGYFIPAATGDGYQFSVWNGSSDNPWTSVDDDTAGTGNDPTDAPPFILGDDDAYEQMSAQMIALGDDDASPAPGYLLIFGAINYAANDFEIRFAHVTAATDLNSLKTQLNGQKITSPLMGYYDQLVPGSVKLARDGTSTECHLYYDRLTSTVGLPPAYWCTQPDHNDACGSDIGESYGTAIIKSVANINPYWIGSIDNCLSGLR